VLNREKPFVKTPKKARKLSLKITLSYWIITFLLVISIIKGILYLLTSGTSQLWFATLINVAWATYLFPFFVLGLYLSYKP